MATVTADRGTDAKSRLMLRLRRPLLAHALLLVSLLGAFGAFNYEQIARLGELSRLCTLALFLSLALSTRLDSKWVSKVFIPVFGLGLFVLAYAYIFTLRTGAPLFPSVLAQRNYVSFLLGPIVYMLYLRGWSLRDFLQIFLAAVSLTVLTLVVYDVTMASSSLLLSGTFFALNLGEFTEQSLNFRLVNTSALFLVLYCGRRLFQMRGVLSLVFASVGLAASAAILAISIPRGILASVIVTIIIYMLFLARPERVRLSVLVGPLLIIALLTLTPSLTTTFTNTFGQDRTFLVRQNTAQIAWESFLEYPIFGFGQESVQSATFRDYFGENFFPSDIGLLGVAFQFGLVGVTLYLFLGMWLCWNLLKLVWIYADGVDSSQRTFLQVMVVVCVSFLIAFPLQARFIYSTGLPYGAFAWGLILAHRHGAHMKLVRSANNRDPMTDPPSETVDRRGKT